MGSNPTENNKIQWNPLELEASGSERNKKDPVGFLIRPSSLSLSQAELKFTFTFYAWAYFHFLRPSSLSLSKHEPTFTVSYWAHFHFLSLSSLLLSQAELTPLSSTRVSAFVFWSQVWKWFGRQVDKMVTHNDKTYGAAQLWKSMLWTQECWDPSTALPFFSQLFTRCECPIIIIIITRPRPAFGRLGLVGSSGGYSTCV